MVGAFRRANGGDALSCADPVLFSSLAQACFAQSLAHAGAEVRGQRLRFNRAVGC